MSGSAISVLVCCLLVVGVLATPIGRIVGGADATEKQFPYQISLIRSSSHVCGGSIISRSFVLTAAHCVGSHPPSAFTVRAGSIHRLKGDPFKVVDIIVHEKFRHFLNDVALLKLEPPLIYSDFIKAVALASHQVAPGDPVVISGWGRLEHNGVIPLKLQWNTLTAISREECRKQIGVDSGELICLAHAANNGACHGDSGGPATGPGGELIGVAGFVFGGCGNVYPDGYSNVYYYLDWIREHSDAD